MNRKSFCIIFLLSILLSGCASKFVHKDYQNKKGIVSFLNNGADFVIQQRRNDAEVKMKQFCHGTYTLLAETNKESYAGTVSSLNSTSQTNVSGNINNNGSFSGTSSTSSQAWGTSYATHWNHLYLFFKCNK